MSARGKFRVWGLGFRVVVLALALWFARPLHGAEVPAAFEAANKLYEQGKFSEAVAAYEKLTQSGAVSPALHFNHGNALFKAGRVGAAIVAYRQARALTPRDPDVRANLQFARNRAGGGQVAPPPRARRALTALTLDEWTLLAAAALWAWLALLALGEWRPALKQTLGGWRLMAGLLTGVFALCLGAALAAQTRTREAVVVTAEVVVRYGPLEESKSFYTARDGTELRVLGQKDDWLQVSDNAQRTGWLRRSQVVVFPRS